MKAKLYKVLDQYHLYDGDKAIATTIVGNPMLLPNLSKQNCDSIFGVVDVEKLAEKLSPNSSWKHGFIKGFNKAMELNKDKVFTIEDMRTAMLNAIEMTDFQKEQFRKDNDYHIALDIIQSLQQPTEIDVVIVMRPASLVYKSNLVIEELDSEGCLILKHVV